MTISVGSVRGGADEPPHAATTTAAARTSVGANGIRRVMRLLAYVGHPVDDRPQGHRDGADLSNGRPCVHPESKRPRRCRGFRACCRDDGLEVHPSAPPWSWPPPAPAFSFSGRSEMSVSVVRTMAAMEAAFWSAERVTLAASTMPFLNRSPYSPLSAS